MLHVSLDDRLFQENITKTASVNKNILEIIFWTIKFLGICKNNLSEIFSVFTLSSKHFTRSKSTVETLEKGNEICSKLPIKTHELVCCVNFEHISHLFLEFILFTLNK